MNIHKCSLSPLNSTKLKSIHIKRDKKRKIKVKIQWQENKCERIRTDLRKYVNLLYMYLVGSPFALITASIQRGMEVISLWHCCGGMVWKPRFI